MKKVSVALTLPARWQDCELFVESMIKRQYLARDVHGQIRTILSTAFYLYMYEAFLDGYKAAVQ